MTLSAFARLLDAPPKWVLNTLRALDLAPRYTLALAQRFTIMRAVHEGVGMPLPAAYALAGRALSRWSGGTDVVTLHTTASDDVALTVDVYRLLSSVNVRLADLRESYAPMVRGRPRATSASALSAATAWGLDLSLVRDNLRKTPLERLRQLDGMLAFTSNVQRTTSTTRPRHV